MESGDEDDLSMAQRDTMRMEEKLHKEGFREGVEKGREENLQLYFDATLTAKKKHVEEIGLLCGEVCYVIDTGSSEHAEKGKKLHSEILEYMSNFQKCKLHEEAFTSESQNFENRLQSLKEKWNDSYQTLRDKFQLIIYNDGLKY